jgi:hypothetical protein
MHTSTHTILYGPDGLIEAELPLDREPYVCLVRAVLAWTGPKALAERDYEQIALQLTGHARPSPPTSTASPPNCWLGGSSAGSPGRSGARRVSVASRGRVRPR